MNARRWGWIILLLGTWVGLTSLRSFGANGGADDDLNADAGGKKKKIIYRSHTQLDFSGETVQGKVRAPEVFYIFQRKRSEAHHVVQTPLAFDYHASAVQAALQGELGSNEGRAGGEQ